MSWSVQGIGKAPAVALAIDKQFTSSGPCAEPEETVRQAARAAIAAALTAQKPEAVIQVTAQGSQSTSYVKATPPIPTV